jgi:alkylation response protein AidB-like acyl-CoA dehydrogenase
LLAAVEDLRPTLLAHLEESESQGKLAEASVAAFREAGLYGLKLPAELGGFEADPMLQVEVIEAVSRIHPTAGWNLFICGTGIGLAGAFLPAAAIPQVFAGGRIPLAAGVLRPRGQARPVPGGYRVSGRWPFASGVRNAEWFCGGTAALGNGTSPETRMIFVPTSQIILHDNWQVMGLQGTGSCDVSIDDLFVPQEFTWVAWQNPQRGGPLYRMGRPAFVAAEHAAFAVGAGRLALDAIIEMAQGKQRGYTPETPTIARRATFQRDLAEADLKLRAARSLILEVYQDVWAAACAGQPLTPQQQAETRSATCYATQVAAEVATLAYRYGGGEANYLTSILQRCMRDINGAAQHQLVNNDAYEEHAQGLLGLTGKSQ